MEALKTIFEGKVRFAEEPKDNKPYTFISFMPNRKSQGAKDPESRKAVREAFGFPGKGMWFQGWINFKHDHLALMRQFRLKHKHEGALRVPELKY